MRFSDFQDAIRELDWREFERFVLDALITMNRFKEVRHNIILRGHQYDIVATESDTLSARLANWYFEIKARRNRVGLQEVRQFATVAQTTSTSTPGSRFVLVCNCPLTIHAKEVAAHFGIDVWDPMMLLRIVPDEVLRKYFGVPSGEVKTDDDTQSKGKALVEALSQTEAGRPHWSQYQRLMSEVLEFLFCPPLERPLDEVPDVDRRNRRDMILENGASDGFWSRLRDVYDAHYIVADAKNYVSPLGKTPVLDVAHYLKPHGCGMFGLILSRNGPGGAAKHAMREQWVASRQLIVVLSDTDVEEMVRLKVEAGDPETLLRRKIAEFRISL